MASFFLLVSLLKPPKEYPQKETLATAKGDRPFAGKHHTKGKHTEAL